MPQVYNIGWSVPRKPTEKNELIQIDHYFFGVPVNQKNRASEVVAWATSTFGARGFYTDFDHDRKLLLVGFKTYDDAFAYLMRFG
ncbi:MAG: hypothetical protein EOP84_01750 [Verrucomicrobiaceae bacterium]|nr:MAG: hypothetical protein EOP84_01750 [Verrucomicrobiaceae bacterium]